MAFTRCRSGIVQPCCHCIGLDIRRTRLAAALALANGDVRLFGFGGASVANNIVNQINSTLTCFLVVACLPRHNSVCTAFPEFDFAGSINGQSNHHTRWLPLIARVQSDVER